MKMLLATLEFPPDNGGVARYLGIVAKENADIIVMSPSSEHELEFGRGWFTWTPLLRRIPQLLRQTKADTLLISHVLPMGYPAIVARLLGYRVVILCHGLDILQPRNNWWKRLLVGCVLRVATRVIANSEATALTVRSYGIPEKKISVVHPPLSWDAATVRGSVQAVAQLPAMAEDKRVILFVNRFVARKGGDVAIAAMKIVKKYFPNVLLVCIGDGPERNAWQAAAHDVGVSENVSFLGRCTDEVVRQWLRAASVVIYPSKDIPGDPEGYGMGAADAGLFAKPVIASRIGGLPEAVIDNETGVLVAPNDAEALARAIIALCEDTERAKALGNAGKARADRWTHEAFRSAFFSAVEKS